MRIKGALRVSAATGLALALGLGAKSPVLAQSAPTQATSNAIPPMPLRSALDLFAQRSGIELVYVSKVADGIQTSGAPAGLSPEEALNRLLHGTGLTYQRDDGAFMILAADVKSTPRATAPVETVVVTAEKKKENIQQVPIAITALSQQQLTDRQIAGGPDLLKSVPNMDFTKTNFSGYNIELRGIGTQAISVTTDPAVAVAFNDTPFIRNHFFEQEFYDVQDVEVLLGPQGTLYGRNANAGVVNLKSALPTDQYEAMLSADMGNYNNRRLEGMINIPIVGDKLDIRIASEWTKRDGYTTDTDFNAPVDGRDLWSGRITIGWNPASNFHSDFIWEHFSEDDDRLRSAKQICETAQPPSNISGQVGNYAFNQSVPPSGLFGADNAFSFNQQYLSQGCQATSLYSASAFQVPYGASLPYVIGAKVEGLLNFVDPYAEGTQSTNLRQIQSTLPPTYRARNDTVEYNATWTISPALTLTSLTGFNQDFLWSTEDYNRFDTAPGMFRAGVAPDFGLGTPNPAGYEIPDPAIPGAAIFCDPQLGCSDRLVAEDLDVEHAWQLSQEFRLSSNFNGPFNFSVGGNYLHYETDENYYVFANTLTAFAHSTGTFTPGTPGGNDVPGKVNCLFTQAGSRSTGFQSPNPFFGGGAPAQDCVYIDPNPIGSLNNEGHNYFLSRNPYTLNSYALFGETYYNFTPTLKLTTGLRWTVDQKHFVDIPSEVIDQGYGYWVSGIENQTWERPTGRAVLDWTPSLDFTDQTLLYASYAHGYKAGGANPPGAIFPVFAGSSSGLANIPFVDHPLTFKPEYIEAFELGTKNTLLDGSLTLNGDIFYYNYTGYQISEIVDRTAINNNYNAHVEGAEITANWEPMPGLKFNFAGGYEDTAAAGGDSGIDLMDRTAGMPGWTVVKPFATQASNCILPTYVVGALLQQQAETGGANFGWAACRLAYTDHLDPVTGLPYQPNPSGMSADLSQLLGGNSGISGPLPIPPNYPGFNPLNPAYNNGEGFAKNLAGHRLPNAPPFTLSLGGEYSMPVSQDWLATLRADFYWQADSWARIFNDNPYDRIHGYDTLNLTLILNSANGWTVMGYIKNVFNTTAITGDFLNSDDSGLTTNVFLTDPRLFGVRVTKHLDENEGFWGSDWSGTEWIKDIFEDSDNGKPPLWIELGGQLEHIQGQGATFVPAFYSNFGNSSILHEGTTPLEAQHPPLFSVGEEAKISFQPSGSDWIVSAAIRYGRSGNKRNVHHQTDKVHYEKYQNGVGQKNNSAGAYITPFTQEKFADTTVHHAESHSIMDFQAGKDVGLGLFGEDLSTVLSGGIRIAQFASRSSVDVRARPDLHWFYCATAQGALYCSPPAAANPNRFNLGPYFHTYHAVERASRKFKGVGPSISWTGSVPVLGNNDASGFAVDWGANAAVLFGRQKTSVSHQQTGRYFPKTHNGNFCGGIYSPAEGVQCAYPVGLTAGGHHSNRSVTVPNIGGFAGLSYRYQNAKISLGYRADFFFGAIDGGIDKRHSETLNMGGPFATISLGLGG